MEQVSQYTPDTFPLDGNRRLVAPFWADVDTRKGGDVFYRETTDPNLLQQATDQVAATYVNQQNFRATWLFIATWNEVAFYGASNSSLLKVRTLDVHFILHATCPPSTHRDFLRISKRGFFDFLSCARTFKRLIA